jgi:hypothetical protein
MLRCAAARAHGGVLALKADGMLLENPPALDVVCAVLRANAGMRELRTSGTLHAAAISAVLQAAPTLHEFHADVMFGSDEVALARAMLRNEDTFQPMRLRQFHLVGVYKGHELVALARDLAGHASLRDLQLSYCPLVPGACDALLDAATTRRLQALHFVNANLSPAAVPRLARLLRAGALTELRIENARQRLLDNGSAANLCAALRGNNTLKSITLAGVGLWRNSARAGIAVVRALTAHTSVEKIALFFNAVREPDQAAVGAALGALVAANAPALLTLELGDSRFGDEGLRPLFEALPANTHLRTLCCCANYEVSEACARDVLLLPAVRANTSLRALGFDLEWASALEAQEVVKRRGAAEDA